ncbi:MAG: alpha/beta hydrolase [Chloroflexota bacterium]|nr:alpha/beta hydrolase [Chloroflexota bacterium]
MPQIQTGYAEINNARLYYELAGRGRPFVMIHAGIADCRMWEEEFAHFAKSHRVLRFDMRGYGKSLPVEGEFNIQDDLRALLAFLDIGAPVILMGCSIGAGLAIDYALTHPDEVQSLILVGGEPAGFEADVEWSEELFTQSEEAFQNGDVDRVAEIDMKIWFDGFGRSAGNLNQEARKRGFEMARQVAEHEIKDIGTHVRKTFEAQAVDRLAELKMPSLVIIGENDLPFLKLAADYLSTHIPDATRALISDAAHLPNMEHPEQFRAIVEDFLSAG